MTEFSQSQSETLAQRLERGPIEPQAALAILEQLLTGLEPVHAGGAVNGRITPEVIHLAADGRATFAEPEAEAPGDEPSAAGESGLPDNPGYMAPELISGDFVDARTDVFALGVIAYEMLTGRNPFSAGEGAPPGTVVYRIVYRPYPEVAQNAVPGLTADIRSMVATAMARDPGSRFADATRFLEALRPAASSLKGAGFAAGAALAAGAGAAKAGAQPKGKTPKAKGKSREGTAAAAGAAAAASAATTGGAAGTGGAAVAATAAAGTGASTTGAGAAPPPTSGAPGPEEGGFIDAADRGCSRCGATGRPTSWRQ